MACAISVQQSEFGRAAILDLNCPLVVHAHPQYHVLIKLYGDDTQFGVADDIYPLSSDKLIAVNAWEPHHYPHHSKASNSVILALYIEPLWLAANTAVSSAAPYFPHCSVSTTPEICQLTNTLAAELIHGAGRDLEFVSETVCDCMRAIAAAPAPAAVAGAAARPLAGARDYRIRHSIANMQDHVGEPIDFAQLAREAGLSRSHFFSLFRENMHMTPSQYLNLLRMEGALAALGDSSRSINTVAHDLGFSAHSNFTRFFTCHQGVSPREYRKAAIVATDGRDMSMVV